MATRRLTRQESQAETRKRLLEAANAVFATHGFGGATVEQIASQAGFTRGAFYSNFASKDDLFLALLEQRLGEGIAAVSGILEMAGSWDGMIERLRERGMMRRPANVRWFLLISEFRAYALRHPRVRARLAEHERRERRALARAVVLQFEAAGVDPPAEPERIALLLQCLDHGLQLEHVLDPETVELGTFADFLPLLFEAATALSRSRAPSRSPGQIR